MSNKNAWKSALLLLFVFTNSGFAKEDTIDVPSPVQVITSDMLKALPESDRSIEDILKSTPGVSVTGESENTILRGPGAQNPVVLVDGQLVKTPKSGKYGPLPPDFIDRIEILPGPQNSLYGSGPGEGAVNVVTNDRYTGRDLDISWLLTDLNRGLSRYNFAIESNEKCDATHGSPVPHWTYSNDWDYGLPKISLGGEHFRWGSKSKGFDAGFLYTPKTRVQWKDEWLKPFGSFTFDGFNKLQDRINNDPDAHEQDKRDFIGMMLFASALAGPGGLSDQAGGLFHFDPDEAFEDFKKFFTNRTDAERAEFLSEFKDAPQSPGPTTASPVPAAPAATTAASTPDPFDSYPYPPEYAFDFGLCTDEQKIRVLEIISERDQARADNSYYMDYLRRPGQTAEGVADDEANAANAIETRNAKNEELRKYWQSCVNPQTTQATAAESTTPSSEVTEPELGYRFGNSLAENWNLEFHIDYDDLDADKSDSDIAVEMYRYDLGMSFSLPFTPSLPFRYDSDYDAGSSRTFFNDEGVARFDNAVKANLGRSRLKLGFDLNGETDAGIKFGATVYPSELEDEPEEDNWRISLDYDLKGIRNGPTIRLKYDYSPVDSMYQEYVPGWDKTKPKVDLSAELQETLDSLQGYGSDLFSFGGKNFRTFTAPEDTILDWSALDYLKGQTYSANNECGDSALPLEDSGYLTAEQSPVKSVDDQWAMNHVGLNGDEPTLDEFAKPVIVGVIDTGIDWNHLDFSWDNLWRNEDEIPDNGIDDDGNGFVDDIIGWNFMGENNRPWDSDGHGTFVAGIIAATQDNNAGINGINSHAKIMVIKALNNFGRTRASYVAQAIVYGADNGAQILNLSVTGPGFPKIVQDAVDYAESKGVLVINAAGNRAEDIGKGELAPLSRVLTVAATGRDDKRAIFSNVGAAVDIAAPGVDVVSLRARATDFMYSSRDTSYVKEDAFLGEDRRYYRSTGTSFATPIVTGVASLVLSNNPGLTPAELKRVLEQSARDVEMPGRDQFTGYGIVDARAALAADPAFFVYAAIPAVRPVDVDGMTFVEVIGVADADQFESATLEIGQGEAPESWAPVGMPLVEAVQFAALGQIPAEQFTGATTWTIRLLVKHQNGSVREARYVVDL